MRLRGFARNQFPDMRDTGFLDELVYKGVRIKPVDLVARDLVSMLTQRPDGKCSRDTEYSASSNSQHRVAMEPGAGRG
jgi:hypothetical protein